VWRWDQQEPFGVNVPDENPSALGVFEFPLRFPGQYFDIETGLHYNHYRDYDANLGRYGRSDPIGLLAGLNTYAYIHSSPLDATDPLGLIDWNFSGGVGGMGFWGTGGGSLSAGVIAGGGNVCFYEQVCILLGYGFAGGVGFEGGIGIGRLCSGVSRSVGVFGVAGKGLFGGGSISTRADFRSPAHWKVGSEWA
jgi:RHS repeat-associated protein